MPDATIRNAQSADTTAIVELCQLHANHEQSEISKHQLNGSSLTELLFSADSQVQCLVVEVDGFLVGYATFVVQYSTWHAEKYLYLDCLYLKESARSQGLARELMQRVQDHARSSGCDHVQWQTPTFNFDAIEFYGSIGASSKPKQRFVWPLDAGHSTKTKPGILAPPPTPYVYRPRATRMLEVRSVNDWQLKVYEIMPDGTQISGDVIEAALQCAHEQTVWPTGQALRYGFFIVHPGDQAVWALNQIWMDDILRQFVFYAPVDNPTNFSTSPWPGFNACVWDLGVTIHERDAWVKHVMADPQQPQFDAYLNDSLLIE